MEPPQPPRRGSVLRPNRTRVRKKFTHVKKHVKPKAGAATIDQSSNVVGVSSVLMPHSNSGDVMIEHEPDFSHDIEPSSPNPSIISVSSSSSISQDHDYCSRPSSSISLSEFSEDTSMDPAMPCLLSPTSSQPPSPWILPAEKEPVIDSPPPIAKPQEDFQSLLLQARNMLFLLLPVNFVALVDNQALHVLMVGRREEKATQRQVTVYPSGDVKIQVDGQDLSTADSILKGARSKQLISESNIGYFVDRVADIVVKLRLLEICAGLDQKEFKEAWSESSQFGTIDNDTYKECRYTETFRSKGCALLVEPNNWRCKECSKLLPALKRKMQGMQCETPHANTWSTSKRIKSLPKNRKKSSSRNRLLIDYKRK